MDTQEGIDPTQFQGFPKIARLNRDIVITEKLDGTNAAIAIGLDGQVIAQSRNKIITVGDDNYGFAGWVKRNEERLRETLGPGRHFGEWWGQGIQRKYGLDLKRFSLFNVDRWSALPVAEGDLCVVPTLYNGPYDQLEIAVALTKLREMGSFAARGFMDPEGIVIYHTAARTSFKVTLVGDEKPKGSKE